MARLCYIQLLKNTEKKGSFTWAKLALCLSKSYWQIENPEVRQERGQWASKALTRQKKLKYIHVALTPST